MDVIVTTSASAAINRRRTVLGRTALPSVGRRPS
jgi:hypothetical protein